MKANHENPGNGAPAADPPDGLDRDVVMTLTQAAQYLNCSNSTLYRMVKRGDVPAFRFGGTWRFHRSEVHKWIASLIISAAQGRTKGKAGSKRRKGRPYPD